MAGAPETRRPADHRLVKLLPQRRRPHESLVVEAGDEDRREQRIDRSHIEADARPGVLAARLEALKKLRDRRARIGLAPRAAAQFDQRIRLLGSRREHTPRTVILERAADQTHSRGEQSGGHGVAGKPAVAAPVELEIQRPRAIHDPLLRQAIRLRGRAAAGGTHGRPRAAPPAVPGRTARISCVRVLRVTLSQLRHPNT